MPKEHAQIFTGTSVRAILAEKKTQTRRVISRRNSLVDGYTATAEWWASLDFSRAWIDPGPSPAGNPGPYLKVPTADDDSVHRVFPRVQVGDRLWVRETWAQRERERVVAYKADGECGAWIGDGAGDLLWLRHGGVIAHGIAARPESWRGQCYGLGYFGGRWRPSIHMPRWASRLSLDVVASRPERLQDIATADCWAEGIPSSPDVDPSHEYRELWDSLNAKRGHAWERNDWVWAYTFRRVTP